MYRPVRCKEAVDMKVKCISKIANNCEADYSVMSEYLVRGLEQSIEQCDTDLPLEVTLTGSIRPMKGSKLPMLEAELVQVKGIKFTLSATSIANKVLCTIESSEGGMIGATCQLPDAFITKRIQKVLRTLL